MVKISLPSVRGQRKGGALGSNAFRILLIILGSAGLFACWRSEDPIGTVTICPMEGGQTEIRVHFLDHGRGSAHYPSLRAFEDRRFDVIRVPGQRGTYEAGVVELLAYEGTRPARVESGHVALAAESIEIDLRLPRYNRKTREVVGTMAYRFNGRFSVDGDSCDP